MSGYRPSRHSVVLALVFVAATVLLLWVTDWLARRGAESALARVVQQQTGATERPSVDVQGALFLPQMLRGRYDHVDVDIDGISSGPLRIDSVRAELRDVYLAFPDLLRGRTDQIVIAESQEQALLTYADLNTYLELTGRPFVLEPAGSDTLQLTGSIDVLDQTFEASADARLATDEGALVVEPTRVGAARDLDGISSLLLGQRFSFRVPLDPLPFGQRLTRIEAGRDGVEVDAEGAGVVLDP